MLWVEVKKICRKEGTGTYENRHGLGEADDGAHLDAEGPVLEEEGGHEGEGDAEDAHEDVPDGEVGDEEVGDGAHAGRAEDHVADEAVADEGDEEDGDVHDVDQSPEVDAPNVVAPARVARVRMVRSSFQGLVYHRVVQARP